MAATNLTGARSRADHRVTPPRFPSHVAARIEADWDGNRRAIPTIPGPRKPIGHVGDSDPDMDEALRRVQTELAYIERASQPLAEYEAWAGSAA